jgi:hypothetical protein
MFLGLGHSKKQHAFYKKVGYPSAPLLNGLPRYAEDADPQQEVGRVDPLVNHQIGLYLQPHHPKAQKEDAAPTTKST